MEKPNHSIEKWFRPNDSLNYNMEQCPQGDNSKLDFVNLHQVIELCRGIGGYISE